MKAPSRPEIQTVCPEVEIDAETWAAIEDLAETWIQQGKDRERAFRDAVSEVVMLEPQLVVDGEGKGPADLGGDGDVWERVGRAAVATELTDARGDLNDILHDLVDGVDGHLEDPSPDQIQQARRALNRAEYVLEERLAPIAGAEQWPDPANAHRSDHRGEGVSDE